MSRPPVRIIHLGLGAFHRAHQAVYTAAANDGWGIAAFTSRSPRAAELLAAQDGIYTVVVRGATGDETSQISSIVETYDGANLAALTDLASRSEVGVMTLTVTEAGYRLTANRHGELVLDTADPEVAADVTTLQEALGTAGTTDQLDTTGLPSSAAQVGLTTIPARMVLALAARRAAQAGPIAIVPCDNLPHNAAATRAAVLGVAQQVNEALSTWIKDNVSFVGTSVDRITPATTEADIQEVAQQTGFKDEAAVITEPFTSWILAGEFPAGRPAWERGGAVFVDEVEPFERRKLWLLNGAHSLLAYAGQQAGHRTVDEAIASDTLRAAVEEFWDEASQHMPGEGLDLPAYRTALIERFANPRIAHHLAQIGKDGTLKLAARQVPVLLAERQHNRPGTGAVRALAAWVDYVLDAVENSAEISDPAAEKLYRAAGQPASERTRALLAVIDTRLDDAVIARGVEQLSQH